MTNGHPRVTMTHQIAFKASRPTWSMLPMLLLPLPEPPPLPLPLLLHKQGERKSCQWGGTGYACTAMHGDGC